MSNKPDKLSYRYTQIKLGILPVKPIKGSGDIVKHFYHLPALLFTVTWCCVARDVATAQTTDFGITSPNPLAMPAVGEHRLRVLSPTLLELTLITTKQPNSAVE